MHSAINQSHKHRHTNELRAQILSALPSRITRIIYLSHLPYTETKKHLLDLERRDLLRQNIGTGEYIRTDKGSKFLGIYYQMRRELEGN